MLFIGIDLGTSACKLLLVGEDGTIQNEVTKGISPQLPAPRLGRAEAGGVVGRGRDRRSGSCCAALMRNARASAPAGRCTGLVALDEHDHVIRPAILWNDGRTFKEVDYLNNVVGKDRLSRADGKHRFCGLYCPEAPLDA